MEPIAKLIQWFSQHDGYAERPVNRTIFAEHLDGVENPRIPRQGSAWCGTFVDDGFYSLDLWQCLLTRNFGTSAAAQVYIAKRRWRDRPVIGDLAFYKTSGPGHIGYVADVSATHVWCWEGNTTPPWKIFGDQRNGGQVAFRRRSLKWWAGFGMPDYSKANASATGLLEFLQALRASVLHLGSAGVFVKVLQDRLGLEQDGIFGPITQRTLVSFQTFVGLPATGRTDQATWAALFGEATPG